MYYCEREKEGILSSVLLHLHDRWSRWVLTRKLSSVVDRVLSCGSALRTEAEKMHNNAQEDVCI